MTAATHVIIFVVFLAPAQCSSVQSLSVSDSAIPWTAAHQASLSITISQSLLKLMSVKPLMLSNHLMLCRPLLLLPSILPSIRVFSNESVFHIRWPKYWSFSISPPKEYSGLISFRIDWFDLAVQGTLKSLLQHHCSKALILWCSAFFMEHFLAAHSWPSSGLPCVHTAPGAASRFQGWKEWYERIPSPPSALQELIGLGLV